MIFDSSFCSRKHPSFAPRISLTGKYCLELSAHGLSSDEHDHLLLISWYLRLKHSLQQSGQGIILHLDVCVQFPLEKAMYSAGWYSCLATITTDYINSPYATAAKFWCPSEGIWCRTLFLSWHIPILSPSVNIRPLLWIFNTGHCYVVLLNCICGVLFYQNFITYCSKRLKSHFKIGKCKGLQGWVYMSKSGRITLFAE